MEEKRGFVPVAMILIFLSIFVGLYYLRTLKSNDHSIKTNRSQNPQPTELLTYVSKIAPFSFQYTTAEQVISAGGYEGSPEESDTIIIVDKNDENIGLVDILITHPPTGRFLENEQEALKEIVGYWSSSTSQYLSPELNRVTGPIQTVVKVKNLDNQSTLAYLYEIAWQNDPRYSEVGNGTNVWLFIPTKVDWQSDPDRLGWFDDTYVFLWLAYDKEDEARILPILNSFAVTPNSN